VSLPNPLLAGTTAAGDASLEVATGRLPVEQLQAELGARRYLVDRHAARWAALLATVTEAASGSERRFAR